MKVISKVEYDPNWSIEVTCHECETVLEIVESDIIETIKDDYHGDCYNVVCEVCNTILHVHNKRFPKMINNEIVKNVSAKIEAEAVKESPIAEEQLKV